MPEINTTFSPADKYKTCIYVDVDETGAIITAYIGQKVIPDRQYHYFFYEENYVGVSIQNYKVTIVNAVPKLEALDPVLEQTLMDAYFS